MTGAMLVIVWHEYPMFDLIFNNVTWFYFIQQNKYM